MQQDFDLVKGVQQCVAPIKKDIAQLIDGCLFWKVRSTKWYLRRFWLDTNSLCLRYEHTKKPFWTNPVTHVDLTAIDQVSGWKSSFFRDVSSSSGCGSTREDQCLTIIYGARELNLVAPNPQTAAAWLHGLNKLLGVIRSFHLENTYQIWLTNQFLKADKDKSGELDFNELLKLLDLMNIKLSHCYAFEIFSSANVDKTINKKGEQVLDSKEFIRFVTLLTKRGDLQKIFTRYAKTYCSLMTESELCEFLKEEQHMSVDHRRAKEIINKYQASDTNNEANLTVAGFTKMMTCRELFNIAIEEHRSVHQDMTRPLNQYYIASSHNTYLTGNQLTGKSSVGAYIEVLESGCRCLELDLWDGPNGEPLIYHGLHGYSMTNEITVRDVLTEAIKPYAFKASPYPLILSLENHLSSKQQKTMALQLSEIFEDMLYVDPVSDDMTDFPSPEELKYKIIIKAKKAGSERNRSSSRHIKLSLASPSDIDSLTEEANLQETDQSSLVDYCKSLNDSSITVPTKIESSNDQSAPEKGTPSESINASNRDEVLPPSSIKLSIKLSSEEPSTTKPLKENSALSEIHQESKKSTELSQSDAVMNHNLKENLAEEKVQQVEEKYSNESKENASEKKDNHVSPGSTLNQNISTSEDCNFPVQSKEEANVMKIKNSGNNNAKPVLKPRALMESSTKDVSCAVPEGNINISNTSEASGIGKEKPPSGTQLNQSRDVNHCLKSDKPVLKPRTLVNSSGQDVSKSSNKKENQPAIEQLNSSDAVNDNFLPEKDQSVIKTKTVIADRSFELKEIVNESSKVPDNKPNDSPFKEQLNNSEVHGSKHLPQEPPTPTIGPLESKTPVEPFAKLASSEDLKTDCSSTSNSAEFSETVDGASLSLKSSLSVTNDEIDDLSLSDLVNVCQAITFQGFQRSAKLGRCFHVSSLSETKAEKLVTDCPNMIQLTNRQMIRIYPKGSRTDSSNYNPIPFWNTGCQLVALNYQTRDINKFVNSAKFMANGNCGYVLKPDVFHSTNSDFLSKTGKQVALFTNKKI